MLCIAAEVSLPEHKKTGDSVVLFVASSTASHFHFTSAYYFEFFHIKQLKYINILQKEKPTIFKQVPLLGRLKTWINDDGVSTIIMENYHFNTAQIKGCCKQNSRCLCKIHTNFLSTSSGLSVSLLYTGCFTTLGHNYRR